jgi:hypothetical protein
MCIPLFTFWRQRNHTLVAHDACMEIVIAIEKSVKTFGFRHIGYPYFTMLYFGY